MHFTVIKYRCANRIFFSRAQDHPCCIVIKPTKGDFLHDYQNRNNLHIGLTNSKGFVVEYDSQGLHRFDTCGLIANQLHTTYSKNILCQKCRIFVVCGLLMK